MKFDSEIIAKVFQITSDIANFEPIAEIYYNQNFKTGNIFVKMGNNDIEYTIMTTITMSYEKYLILRCLSVNTKSIDSYQLSTNDGVPHKYL